MNAPIRNLAVACLVLFLALLANVTYVQFVEANSLNERPNNKRVIDEEFSRERGAILVDGAPIAQSVPVDDQYEFQRQYPEGPLYANITGYFSYIYGNSGIERTQNRVLSGSDDRLFVNRVVDLLANNKPKGGTVELTLNSSAQRTAAAGLQALGTNTRGAVAAIDPETGAILALVTQPTFDPNLVASHDFDAVVSAKQTLDADPTAPLIDRATQQTLPPGSTFKLVTAAAAISSLGLTPDAQVKGGPALSFPGINYQLTNLDGGSCGGDPITFQRALSVSCNVSFGALADQIGQDKLAEQARKFGFGDDVLQDVAANASRMTRDNQKLELPQLAQTGIGQFEVAATPLQMAMVAGGIANDGVVMTPYLVSRVSAPNLRVLEEAKPETYDTAVTPEQARTLQDMMVDVVQNGTGGVAKIDGVEVGGKTGTAQSSGDRPPYAWFVSYAKAGDRQVAVAVVVESSDTGRDEIAGGRLAGPIARSVMQAVLGQ